AGADFSQRKRRDRSGGAARKIFPFLFGRAENLERLRDAYGLVRRKQRQNVRVVTADQFHRAAILEIAEAQAAIFFRYLHPESAEPLQSGDDLSRIFARPVNGDRVHVIPQKLLQLPAELGELRPLFAVKRERMDQIELELSEKQIAQESAPLPFGSPRLLGDLAGFLLAGDRYLSCSHSSPH